MKLTMLSLTFLGLTIVGFGSEADAIPAFPRDLTCVTISGKQVTLRSNNGFWSQAQNGRYKVELLITQEGNTTALSVNAVNNEAQRVRGNDEGLKEYIFLSESGEAVSLSLEFNAPHGLATSTKKFVGVTASGEILVDANRDSCDVIFYPRTEI